MRRPRAPRGAAAPVARALLAGLAGVLLLGLLTAPSTAAAGPPSGPAAAGPAGGPGVGPGLRLGVLQGLRDLAAAAADDRSGATGADADLLRRARVAVEGRTERDRGGRAVAPTLTLADVFAAYPRLSARQRRLADALLARPTDGARDTYGDGYDSPEAEPLCGPRVCVHHVAPGSGDDAPPDRAWVRRTLRVMEKVWTHHVDEMGFRAPASDLGRGGDERFDVYLADVGEAGYYGYCTPERPRPGEERRSSGYCVLDNDFAEFDGPALRNLKVTAAHEFFHAVQFDYDVGEDRWFMEATAVWMEGRFAPRARDNEQYLRFGQLGRPAVPLDAYEPTGLAHYGNWVFFQRLTERYGVDAVRRLWDRVAAGEGDPDEYSTQAVSRFLRARGSSLRAFLAVFAGGNLTPRRAYADGASYDPAPLAGTRALRAGGTTRFRARLPHLASRSFAVVPGGRAARRPERPQRDGRDGRDGRDERVERAAREGRRDTRPRLLRIEVRGPAAPVRTAARVLVQLRDGRVKARPVRLGRDGRDAVQVPFAGGRVRRVTLTLVNASARYRCWEGRQYSCAGEPRDDGQVLSARVRAVR